MSAEAIVFATIVIFVLVSLATFLVAGAVNE